LAGLTFPGIARGASVARFLRRGLSRAEDDQERGQPSEAAERRLPRFGHDGSRISPDFGTRPARTGKIDSPR
jgi:hypothetical protein